MGDSICQNLLSSSLCYKIALPEAFKAKFWHIDENKKKKILLWNSCCPYGAEIWNITIKTHVYKAHEQKIITLMNSTFHHPNFFIFWVYFSNPASHFWSILVILQKSIKMSKYFFFFPKWHYHINAEKPAGIVFDFRATLLLEWNEALSEQSSYLMCPISSFIMDNTFKLTMA